MVDEALIAHLNTVVSCPIVDTEIGYSNKDVFGVLCIALDVNEVDLMFDVDYETMYEDVDKVGSKLTIGYTYSFIQWKVFDSLAYAHHLGGDHDGRQTRAAWCEKWFKLFRNKVDEFNGFDRYEKFIIH